MFLFRLQDELDGAIVNRHWKVEFLLMEAKAATSEFMSDAWYQLAAEWMVEGV